jgi:hypothetical protein
MNYQSLSNTSGDAIQNERKECMRPLPWVIQNMLPSQFELYLIPRHCNYRTPLGPILSRETKVFAPDKFKDGDILMVMYRWNLDNLNLKHGLPQQGTQEDHIMPNHVFHSAWKHIRLGDVNYESSRGRETKVLHSDISGVMLNNNLHFPLDVHYNGDLAVQLQAHDGMSYMGGSGSSVFFNNGGHGLRLGDKLTFKYSMFDDRSEMYTITLIDNYTYDINIGVIGVGEPTVLPDIRKYTFNVPLGHLVHVHDSC